MTQRAQTESIGVILLTAVVVVTVGTAGAVMFSSIGTEDRTRADVSVTLSNDGVALAHNGGDPVAFTDLQVVVRNGNGTWRPVVDESTVLNSDGDDQFEAGERWVGWQALDRSEVTTVRVFDTNRGTLLAQERRYPSERTGLTPPPSVAVLDPSGGETFMGGKTATVEWNASQVDAGVERVDIAYSTDGGDSWTTAATDLDNNGSYGLTVPTVDSDEALVRVTAVDAEGQAASNTSNTTFTISRTGLSEESVSDLVSGDAGQEQTISFAVETDLPAGKTVTIDLSNAQSAPDGTVDQVDYRGATSDDSRVTVDSSESDAVVEFTPDSTIVAGETVSFTLTGVETAEDYSAAHAPVFERSDGDAAGAAAFVVKLSGSQSFDGEYDGDVYAEGDVTVEGGSIEGNVTAGGDVSVGEGAINGTVISDGDVTMKEGGTINGNVTANGTVTVNEDGALNGDAAGNGTVTVAEGGAVDGDLESGSALDLAGPVGGDVTGDGDVTLMEGGDVDGSVTSNGTVTVNEDGNLDGGITSEGDVTVNSGAAVGGDIETNGSVTVAASVGDVTSGGDVSVNEGGTVEDIDTEGDVVVREDGTVTGTVTSDGTVTVNEGGTIEGHVNVDSADDIVCEEGATINGQDCESYVDENY